MAHLRNLGIVVGTRCTFDCKHCLLAKQTRNLSLTGREKDLLRGVLKDYTPAAILFTGGETTLYIDDINLISSAHPRLNKTKIGIVTNGGFASSFSEAKRVLSSIRALSHVQLSYDKFHAEFLPKSHITNVSRACSNLGIGFRVISTLQSPLDLGIVGELKRLGPFKIGIQKICDIGEAKKNSVAFRHFEFDKKVLRKFCSNRTQLVYHCGQGFSICCSNLIYNGKYPCLHKTPSEHMESGFYKLMRATSFSRLVKDFGVRRKNLLPEHSSECALCEYTFRTTDIIKACLNK